MNPQVKEFITELKIAMKQTAKGHNLAEAFMAMKTLELIQCWEKKKNKFSLAVILHTGLIAGASVFGRKKEIDSLMPVGVRTALDRLYAEFGYESIDAETERIADQVAKNLEAIAETGLRVQ
jgi:hypothetical protein